MARFERYLLSVQQDDLEQSILGFTEAVLSLPLPHSFTNMYEAFCDLSRAIFLRACVSRRPEDVKYSIIYFRYLHGLGQQHDIDSHFPTPHCPQAVAVALVVALALQAELGLGNVDQDIEEMADLCDEVLNSDISTYFLIATFLCFAETLCIRDTGTIGVRISSEKAIDCLRNAATRLPDLHVFPFMLAQSLIRRFQLTPSDDYYNETIAILDNIIRFRGPGDTPSPLRKVALTSAASISYLRFYTSGKPEHLEQAVYLIRTSLDSDGMSLEDPDCGITDMWIRIHWLMQKIRLDGSGGILNWEDLMYSLISNTSEYGKLPSFRDLTASLPELSAKPLPHTTFFKHCQALLTVRCLSDIADIEAGINYCQLLLASYPDSPLSPYVRAGLCNLLGRAFECTNEIEYLNRAISAGRDSLNTPNPNPLLARSLTLAGLIPSLLARAGLLNRREDLGEIIELLPIAAESIGVETTRFAYLYLWASIARELGHSSVSAAYDRAMSSMQACVTLSPTVDIQHSQLTHIVVMRDLIGSLPVDYASYQIHTNQLKQAIETLEQGRSLLWSEMRGLRASIDHLRFIDSPLADNFIAVSRELEGLTLAKSNVYGRDSDTDAMDPFGDLVVRQRKLLDDREKLISQIQALPGFDTFLKPPSFDTLRSAARHGPVIIINHSEWRSDIIIVLHNSPPSLINTSDDFYDRANELQDQLLGARREDPESITYEDALRSVLKELYELVGQPVIKRLNELNVPEQSRIWWCPTSVFCSLPLHAMGPIQPDVDPPQYFLDLYIPSYIPSLSALIESRKPGTRTIGKPSILLVAHPDENMPVALKEMKAVQAVNTEVTTLFSARATPNAVLSRLRDHRFVHVVCHGILEPGKPFEASFKLHRGKRLLLLDIVRSRLPDAEFAFLSACHTAELTEESIEDEVLHLAAAMQFCGFRSVVGTMWAMADMDGRDLARHFYESVFSEEAQDGRYYERTASALRDAVLNLRRKGGITLERWVNFVHYGA